MSATNANLVPYTDLSILTREPSSDLIAAAFSTNVAAAGSTLSILSFFGTSGELSDGYITVSTLSDWVNRYTEKYSGKTSSDNIVLPRNKINQPIRNTTLPDCTAVTFGRPCYLGLTGPLSTHWWGVHNYLQYGGSCIISGAFGSTYDYNSVNPLADKIKIPNLDVIFALEHSLTGASAVYFTVFGRNLDCIGIMGACGSVSGFGEPVNGIGGQTCTYVPFLSFGDTYAHYAVVVGGNKEHFGLETDSLDVITTPLMADFAGCMARTDREAYPWWSPAGAKRGRILNVLRIPDQLTIFCQNNVKIRNVNYALTVPPQGTYFVTDKTLNTDETSSLETVDVSRLYLYLIKTINPLADKYLFEVNNNSTRTAFTSDVSSILDGVLGQQGILKYEIICDETNNTESVIRAGQFVADIKVWPTRGIYNMTISFTNSNR